MKENCEKCSIALPLDQAGACVCSYGCTYCQTCTQALDGVCPKCQGELVARARRGARVHRLKLYVANRNYSSWSLRAWLALRWAQLPFDEQLIDLDQPGYGEQAVAEVLAIHPSGKLPLLHTAFGVIADSLAIAEWAHEQSGTAALLPADPSLRAHVRAVVAEMHSGFAHVRRALTMNIRRRCKAFGLDTDTEREIARLTDIFVSYRAEFAAQGPWLFGARSLADAFFVPVASRFRTYDISLPAAARAYCDTLLADTDFLHWEQQVHAEPVAPFSRANFEQLYV
jgi:glutathione S-transferase